MASENFDSQWADVLNAVRDYVHPDKTQSAPGNRLRLSPPPLVPHIVYQPKIDTSTARLDKLLERVDLLVEASERAQSSSSIQPGTIAQIIPRKPDSPKSPGVDANLSQLKQNNHELNSIIDEFKTTVRDSVNEALLLADYERTLKDEAFAELS
jgi:hypothetical protein